MLSFLSLDLFLGNHDVFYSLIKYRWLGFRQANERKKLHDDAGPISSQVWKSNNNCIEPGFTFSWCYLGAHNINWFRYSISVTIFIHSLSEFDDFAVPLSLDTLESGKKAQVF